MRDLRKFGELAESVSTTHSFPKKEIIFLNTSDIYLGSVLTNKYSSVDGLPGQAKKSIQKDDILFSEIRPANGRWAYIDFDSSEYVVSTKLMVIRPKKSSEVYSKYLYYFLTSLNVVRKLQHLAESRSGTFPQITFDQVAQLDIYVPSISKQKRLVDVLDSVFGKIKHNDLLNSQLEEMAKAIFKEWFIDFGPVKAKAEGKKPFGMSDEVASLFPDSFEESELGQIPKGWNISSLYDLADWQNGMAFKASHFSDSGLPIVKIVELKSGIDVSTKRTDQKHEEKFKIRDGEILFSWSGSPDTSIDAFIWDKGDAWLNQHIFKVTSKEYGREFTYSLLKHLKPVFIEIARNKQTTGLGHVTVADLKRLQSVVPKIELINAFNIIVGPILNKLFLNLKENQSLVKTRDLILPKLISGEISLNDV